MTPEQRLLNEACGLVAKMLRQEADMVLLALVGIGLNDDATVVVTAGNAIVPPAAQRAIDKFVDAMCVANNSQDRAEGHK